MIKSYKIGTDPEFIIVDCQTGEPRSGIGKLGGTKANPEDIGEGCGVQEDNVTAELTVPPSTSVEEFIYYMNYGRNAINERLKPFNLKLLSASSARYTEEELDNEVARKFGCEPSYCIYTKSVSPRPTPEQIGNLRSAGFHIHIGADRLLTIQEVEALIFYMDVYLGLPSVILDLDTDRKKIYGNAGDFRFKNITTANERFTIVEYRTLGGALHGSDMHIRFVYEQTEKAILAFNNNSNPTINKDVQKAIDKNDREWATKLCQNYRIDPYTIPAIFEQGLVYEHSSRMANNFA